MIAKGYGIGAQSIPQKNEPKAVEMFAGSLNITFNDLRNFSDFDSNQCRFPTGEFFCGVETPDGKPWCTHHHHIAHYTEKKITESDHERRVAQGFKLVCTKLPSCFALSSDTDGALGA